MSGMRRSMLIASRMCAINVLAANTSLIDAEVIEGDAYNTQIVVDEGYSIYEIKITMGGVDITSTAYDPTYNMISISSVTDDVDIECYAMHTMPSDYIRVDGIKNPSNAWMSTDYRMPAHSIAFVDCTRGNSNTSVGIFNSRPTGVTGTRSGGFVISAGNLSVGAWPDSATYFGYQSIGVTPIVGARFTATLDKQNGKVLYNDVVKKTFTPNDTSTTDSSPMCLFALEKWSAGNPGNSAGYIIHFASIKEENAYVRYYIPCLNDSGVAGFWDAARGVFQGSSNSTAFEAVAADGGDFRLINFEDSAVKNICVTNWGGHYKAGEMYTPEARAVTSLGNKFLANTTITKFNELRYFTGLTTLYISGSTSSAQGAFYNCTNLGEVTIPAAPIQNITGSFVKTKVKELDFSPITYVSTTTTVARTQRISHNNTSLKSFVFPSNWKLNSSYYALYAFVYGCSALQTIDTNGCDFSAMNYTNDTQAFNGCSSLTRIIGGLPGMRNTVSLSSSPLTHDAAVELLESLGTVTSARTLTLKTSTYNTLTAEEKAIATNKGWTLDYYN